MATKEGDTKTCNTVWCKIFIRGILMNGYLEKIDKQYFDKSHMSQHPQKF